MLGCCQLRSQSNRYEFMDFYYHRLDCFIFVHFAAQLRDAVRRMNAERAFDVC